jgi:hypothetical protein
VIGQWGNLLEKTYETSQKMLTLQDFEFEISKQLCLLRLHFNKQAILTDPDLEISPCMSENA